MIHWACPKCGAAAGEHGKGGRDGCRDTGAYHGADCQGFICECDHDTAPEHGETFADVCPYARCYHCEWSGKFPVKPRGLQAWERKALDAGWTMPEVRARELGLTTTEKP